MMEMKRTGHTVTMMTTVVAAKGNAVRNEGDLPITISAEVASAIAEGRPVVALESTIIAHGLPWPRNLDVAIDIEARIRAMDVTPATVGAVGGQLVVGLALEQLELMAGREHVVKASVRDLPMVVAAKRDAATTVAATAWLAAKAGIRVFATGGLGGVHRGASATFDESADIATLARIPIVVVCAGVKSILDVPATLERLETNGVTVIGYRTDHFPGFYLTDSGHPVDWRVDEPETVATAMAAADALGLSSAIVVGNPVAEDAQLQQDEHDRILGEAIEAAKQQGVHGKPVTPFLLDYFHTASNGASLDVNVQAVRGNAEVAAQIATAMARQARAR
jgi:pseudouridine-5'-phosphate glycosidase